MDVVRFTVAIGVRVCCLGTPSHGGRFVVAMTDGSPQVSYNLVKTARLFAAIARCVLLHYAAALLSLATGWWWMSYDGEKRVQVPCPRAGFAVCRFGFPSS